MKPGVGSAAAARALFGGAFILIAESAVLAGWAPISRWTTPLCWWGYLLLLDALIQARSGRSPFLGRPARFCGWVSLSILLWLLFEAYNLRLRNWEYVGLPERPAERLAGYLMSFATILPGLFLTALALASFGLFARARCRPFAVGPRALRRSAVAGALCLVLPPALPAEIGRYLFALVWIGFVLLLEPLNYRIGAPSLLRDVSQGRPGSALRLMLAGYLCGLLWEFWNYWAAAKWIYTVPFLTTPRIFEMPVAGFLGFGPFALECYAVYGAIVGGWRRLARRRRAGGDPFSP
jgi:hypothetical protein